MLLLCALALLVPSFVNGGPTTKVISPAGTFQGFTEQSPSGNQYVSFTGIPYGQAPVGALRFERPQPFPKIDGEFDATKPVPLCPHPDVYLSRFGADQGQEDCLFLNIYTTDVSSKTPKKVMVFIHGGGFIVGSARKVKVGTMITAHDVMVVTINYRLGILGFLGTEDGTAPGNQGLWDMTLALKWVKDNIASFGGDPSDVAISGESAGGSAVGYLSISPHTKDLFTKVWPMSGTPTSLFGKALTPQKDTLLLAANLKCFDGDTDQKASSDVTKKVVACLRQLPLSNFTSFSAFHPYNAMYVPTVDNDFVPGLPSKLLKDDVYLKEIGFFDRSYLVGMDNNEAAIMKQHFQTVAYLIKQRVDLTDEEKEASITNMMSAGYALSISNRLDEPASETTVQNIVSWYERRYAQDVIGEVAGDFNFLLPSFDFIDALARMDHEKTWFFHFNHYPGFMKGKERGMIHGLDMAFWVDGSLDHINKVLQAGIDMEVGLGEDDLLLGKLFRSMIADFTQTGGVSNVAKELGVVDWPAYDSKKMKYLDFKARPEIKQNLHAERRQLWLVNALWWNKGHTDSHKHQEL